MLSLVCFLEQLVMGTLRTLFFFNKEKTYKFIVLHEYGSLQRKMKTRVIRIKSLEKYLGTQRAIICGDDKTEGPGLGQCVGGQ